MTNKTASPSTLADIQKAATESIHSSLSAADTERTDRLRDAARFFIDARAHFFTREGEPDWRGRTYAYRTWVREVMSSAHVPGDEVTSLQAAIRYHSGNLLRDRLDEDAIADLGLRKESPRERSVEKRERTSETLNLFGAGGEISDVADIVLLCTLAERALARVNVSNLSADDAEEARAAIRKLAGKASALAKVTK
ncbi:hypothetical protein SEA_CREWMATE_28 [Arthrobacter phage Crewmate]|uniref:Uncharacterized protein n=1 Tax=Arthrobacter phage Crewmate TaxID=2832317 RepID=A0AA48Y3J3_9CAUD|nr:hypothetical protein PQE17_gp28 [Arthrobacter phage Crewmate]UIW13280.1 hypothetical protein SEA_CREWMATE_28 [Arthrobacter phage Crewmate]WGH21203.1 hypothetical protein SEA_OBITOO_27 [Arthrobacter phage ObiToo]